MRCSRIWVGGTGRYGLINAEYDTDYIIADYADLLLKQKGSYYKALSAFSYYSVRLCVNLSACPL